MMHVLRNYLKIRNKLDFIRIYPTNISSLFEKRVGWYRAGGDSVCYSRSNMADPGAAPTWQGLRDR